MKNKVLTTLLSVCLLFTITGCTKSDENLQIDNSSKDGEISIFVQDEAGITQTIQKYLLDNMDEIFGKNIELKWDSAEYYDNQNKGYRELMTTRMNSDYPDDIFIVPAEDVKSLVDDNRIVDLSELSFVERMSDAAKSISSYNGKYYFVPIAITAGGFYWNLDVLKKYNLEVPNTYDEMINVFAKLKANGITPYAGNKGYALTIPAMCVSLSKIYSSPNKDELLKQLKNGTVASSEYFRAGFEFINELKEKGYLDSESTLQTVPMSGEIEKFKTGKAAAICLWQSSALDGVSTVMTGFPGKDGMACVTGTTDKFAIGMNSKNIDLAKEVIEIFASEKTIEECNKNGAISAYKNVREPKYLDKHKDIINQINSNKIIQIPNTDLTLGLNYWDNVRDISRKILSGELDVQGACDELDAKQKEQISS